MLEIRLDCFVKDCIWHGRIQRDTNVFKCCCRLSPCLAPYLLDSATGSLCGHQIIPQILTPSPPFASAPSGVAFPFPKMISSTVSKPSF